MSHVYAFAFDDPNSDIGIKLFWWHLLADSFEEASGKAKQFLVHRKAKHLLDGEPEDYELVVVHRLMEVDWPIPGSDYAPPGSVDAAVAKLREIAKECANCGGEGKINSCSSRRGVGVEEEVACLDCKDIREVLRPFDVPAPIDPATPVGRRQVDS